MPKTILIVEDDLANMRLITDLLEAQGYDTIQSVDGKDTLQLATEFRPDLIIMDIQLPEVSGIDHTKALKADEALKHIPVVAVTAFAKKSDEEKIREAGCDGYITKPVNIPLLLETVAKFLS
ncbi:MAG: response regulator [Rhodospirillales bacterium]|nr:response regulator [Rhodospirillales bacterium]